EQRVGEGRQIIVDGGVGQGREGCQLGFGGATIAGANQYGTAAGRAGCLQVAQAVADGRHPLQIHIEPAADGCEQARGGLSAAAVIAGGMGTVKDAADGPSSPGYLTGQLGMYPLEVFGANQPSANTRLIGGNGYPVSGTTEPSDGFNAPRQRLPFGD